MDIAVLTLTRDRLDYTRHCFASLMEHAGCDFDWYVLDNGSKDGTVQWLRERLPYACVVALQENVGICRGLNFMLDNYCDAAQYDVVVRFDNDCEVVDRGTLQRVATLAYQSQAIVSPRVRGLRNPPPTIEERELDGEVFDETTILGGIFMAIPARLLSADGYRFDEQQPLWAGDELITTWHRARGGRCGYMRDVEVNHYETTDGQHRQYPWYFERRVLEGGPV